MVRTTLVNDIVVLILNSSIPKSHNVDYAKLPYKDFDGIFTISTYGWGRLSMRGHKSRFLMKTKMKTVRTNECMRWGYAGCTTKHNCNHICAIGNNTGTERGDSGGPAVFNDGTVIGMSVTRVRSNSTTSQRRLFIKMFAYLNFIRFHEPNHIYKVLIP